MNHVSERMDISKTRLLSGIRSQRPNPIILNRKPLVGASAGQAEEVEVQAVSPETSPVKFKAYQFDKDYAFHYVQNRWFQRKLELGEELSLTVDQLKMICDEVHEMGRLRERRIKGCKCQLEQY